MFNTSYNRRVYDPVQRDFVHENCIKPTDQHAPALAVSTSVLDRDSKVLNDRRFWRREHISKVSCTAIFELDAASGDSWRAAA